MKIKNVALAGLLVLSVVSSANAEVYRWSFNYNDGGSGVFAFLDFDTVTFDFRIDDNSGQYAGFANNTYLDSPTGVNGISIDFVTSQSTAASAVTSLNGSGIVNYGNTTIGTLTPTTLPAALTGFDVRYATDNNNDPNEINNGESTMFNLGNIAFSNIGGVALRLNTSNGALNSSGIWVPGQLVNNGAPVPEPETTAMMGLGLGLLGFMAKRRKKA